MEKVVYCKSSNERDQQFALHTSIIEEEGIRYLYKAADTPCAEPHVQRIAICEKHLRELYDSTDIRINRCTPRENGVQLEYLEGNTLEEIIDRTYATEGAEAAKGLIDHFFFVAQPGHKLQPFAATDDFCAVFGIHSELDGLPALPIADIDMILPNVICNEDGWHLIDYEWTFFFPVPAEFLRFRALHYFLETSARREWLREDAAARWHIDPQRIPLWKDMESAFQKYIFGGYRPLQELYPQMSPGVTELRALDELDRRPKMDAIRIYWSEYDSLSEEKTLLFPLSEGWNTIQIRLPEGTKKVRLDPGERSAMCSLKEWKIDGKSVRIAAHNGVQISDTVWIFPGEDPQWTVISGGDPFSELELAIKIQPMDADFLESYVKDVGGNKRRRWFF